MIFYHISELMLTALIQKCDKKSFHLKKERPTVILQAVRCHIYDCVNTIYQFIKPFLDNKMSIWNMEPLSNLFLLQWSTFAKVGFFSCVSIQLNVILNSVNHWSFKCLSHE